MRDNEAREQELLRPIERANKYGQTAFVRAYEAELRALKGNNNA